MYSVAILGASGFIGHNLMLNLPESWETFAFYNTAVDFPEWAQEHKVKNGTTFIKQNLSSYEIVSEVVPEHFDIVISLIGDTRKLRKELLPLHNLKSDPLALIGFFKHHTCDKFLYFSSGCTYEGNVGLVNAIDTTNISPFTPYAIAKRASELFLEYFRRDGKIKQYLNVRFFGAYGPYQRADKISTKLIKNFYFDKKNEVTLFGDGSNLIDAMHVDDTIDWIKEALQHDFKNQTIDFGYAKPITIKELTCTIAKICGVDSPKITWDTKNAPKENYFFRLADTWFHPEIPYEYKFKVDLVEGIKQMIQWLSIEENKQWMVSQ